MSDNASVRVSDSPKSLTNWLAFVKAKLYPKEIICLGYHPVHPRDMSCHTRLPRSVDTMLAHIPEHLGGFKITLKESDKEWPGWAKLAESGVELQDFRCDVCDEIIPLSTQRILSHMKAHSGKTRRVRSGGEYLLTLGFKTPLSAHDDDDDI
jgi:hypothetical protein